MEIKIIISDTGAGSQVTASPETLQAAAAIGAIDAGPAPGAGVGTQLGAPPPFISGGNLGDVIASPGISAGSSVAVPDTGSVAAAVIDPGENA